MSTGGPFDAMPMHFPYNTREIDSALILKSEKTTPNDGSGDIETSTILAQFEDYTKTNRTDCSGMYKSDRINYDAIALAGEAGEVAGVQKKNLRGDFSSEAFREEILLEVGDVLHYCSRLLEDVGADMSEAMLANIEKLENRKRYGKGGKGKRS